MQDTSEHAAMQAIATLARSGQIDAARQRAAEAIAAADSPALRDLAAMLALRAGDPAGAVDHLERVHAARPDDRAVRFNLAQALTGAGDLSRVEALLAPLPADARTDRILAFVALQRGDQAQALSRYENVLRTWPDDADSWANRAQSELALGMGDAAVASLETAITHRREEVGFYLALADVLERLDRVEARRTVARDAAKLRPDDVAVQLALGLAEAAAGDPEAAEAALRRAVALDRADPAAMAELGLLLETRNRIDELATLVTAVRPFVGEEVALLEAWLAFRRGDIATASRHAAAIPATISAHRRSHVQAMIADRQQDAAAAFRLFTEMNQAAVEAGGPVPPRRYRDIVADATRVVRDATPAPASVASGGQPAPVFILGFPRSGTTLLDTLLGRLPGAHVLEEQPLIATIEQMVGGAGRIAGLDRAELDALRDRYRTMVAASGGARADLVIDKHPLHMARMPLIDRLFPKARVLLVERHPYDVVLSCFMANFRLNLAMRSFTDLTEAALTYDAVFTAWREAETRLALNVHRVRYERLVTDPASELGAALAFIGADYSPDLLDTAAAAQERGPVKTASYAQVTEPIYQRAVARWQRYREQLEPVIPILRPWAEWMGYDG